MSWKFCNNGINYKELIFPLHNDERDYSDAAKLIWNKVILHTVDREVITMGLPYLPKCDVISLVEQVRKGVLTSSIKDVGFNKIMQSQNQWKLQISHKLHKVHFEKYKKEFTITRILGTPYRVSKYKDFIVVDGRQLRDELENNGWKYSGVAAQCVVGPNDFYMDGPLSNLPKYLDLVYLLHENPELTQADKDLYFPQCSWWKLKDSNAIRMQADLAGVR